MAAEWVQSLNRNSRRLWNGIINYSPVYNLLGRYANTRRLFALGRLSGGSWNTYASHFQNFLHFLSSEQLPLETVTETTLEMYVCYLAEQPGTIKAGTTVASHISGIRSCLRELGIILNDATGTSAALAGYKRFALMVKPAPHQHAAWPLEHTRLVLRRARALLPLFRNGTLDMAGYRTVVGAAHIVLAQLTFSRGHTTNNVLLSDFDFTDTGFSVVLRSQKRPQDHLPHQEHHVSLGRSYRTDPVQFLLDYVEALRHLRVHPDSWLFPTAKGKGFSLDAAVKHFVALCDLRHSDNAPLTGHTIRVGSVSAAFSIGVPLPTCAYMCHHKQVSSTQGYIRHGLKIDTDLAFQYFGNLRPSTGSGHSV